MILQLISLFVAIQVCLGASTGSTESFSNGEFTTDLFAHVTKVDEFNNNNLIFSPASIHTCLALSYFGAEGSTATEMVKGLHFTSPNKDVVAKQFENMLQITRGPTALLKIANKIYTNKLEIKPEFNVVAKKSFESEAEHLDFTNVDESVNTINHWVAERTNDKIKNLVNSKIIKPDTLMVLVNAIHFKGSWKSPLTSYDSRFFNDGTTAKETKLMMNEGDYFYAQFDDLKAKAIKMPYKDSDLNMMIILPNEKTGLHQLEEKLKNTNLLELSKKMKLEDVDLTIPKFRIESEIKLNAILEDMGMKTMFSHSAKFDFFTLPQSCNVDDVIHKAFIDVNELGTEAAASSVMTFRFESAKLNQKFFLADHPFYFAILDNSNVYFTGHLMNVFWKYYDKTLIHYELSSITSSEQMIESEDHHSNF